MVKQVDLFMPPKGQFGVLSHFTKKLHEAFHRAGVKSRLLEAEKSNPKPFIDQIFKDKPDFTLSFNGLLPDDQERFLCDLIKIPHVACLVDSPNTFIPLSRSPRTIIGCTDKMGCQFFKNLNAPNVLFFPHAVEAELTAPPPSQERPYDAVFLGSCIDPEEMKEKWKSKYPSYLSETLELAANLVTNDLQMSYAEALVAAMNQRIWFAGVDVSKFDFIHLLDELEFYVRGKERIGLLQALTDIKIDLFTYPEQKDKWKQLIGPGHDNIVIHDAVPYERALEIMKQSKIILNSSPMFKNGAHERIFAGLASGAMVLTNPSIYVMEEFKEDDGVLIYHLNDQEKLNEDVHAFLSNPKKRSDAAYRGREKVMKHHTWDARVQGLLRDLEPILLNFAE